MTEFEKVADKTRFIGREAKVNFPLKTSYPGVSVIIVDTYDAEDVEDAEEVFWCMQKNGKPFSDGTTKKAFHCSYLELKKQDREWDVF